MPLKKKHQTTFEEQTQELLSKPTVFSELSENEDQGSPDDAAANLRKRQNKNMRQSIEGLIEAHAKYTNYQGAAAQKQAYMVQLHSKVSQHMQDPGKLLMEAGRVFKH